VIVVVFLQQGHTGKLKYSSADRTAFALKNFLHVLRT
jgi:hypothetical protein